MNENEMTVEIGVEELQHTLRVLETLEEKQNTPSIIISIGIAKAAIKKQIPTEPEYSGDGYDENGDLVYDMAKCPLCGNDDFEYGINNWGCDFCPNCGQALDWSGNK